MNKTILVIDDEPSICWAFEKMLGNGNHRVATASSAEEGIEQSIALKPDLIFLDVRLPRQSGLETLPQFIAKNPNTPIVVMTAFGDLETAVSAVKNGASDYLTKPFSLTEVQSLTEKLLASSSVADLPKIVRRDKNQESALIGSSSSMQHVFRQIALVANSDLSVLITGETGTGKELVAAAIHHYSDRSNQPYIPIAPVSLNEDLIESELFGHVKGAYTGASDDRDGLFAKAEGGTILLDEIGDLPIRVQIKLLRVLEQGHYTRVGDVIPRQCNVRIIAATHRDLIHAVQEGSFRRDLFYRLNGLHIHLPPLRERTDDIQPLCEYFLRCIGQESPNIPLDSSLLEELKKRRWSGNIRELRNAVERASVIAGNRAICIDDFHETKISPKFTQESSTTNLGSSVVEWAEQKLTQSATKNLQPELLTILEPLLLQTVLSHTKNNRLQAAEILGIHRSTLREKMRAYGLDRQNES
jgi:two-component system nitrogen regulation response regulator GlnG